MKEAKSVLIRSQIRNSRISGMLNRFPDISKRACWDSLPEALCRSLVAAGEACLDTAWPQLLAEDYMEFSVNGNRSHYEDKMFARRTRLNALVLAECVENQGRFVQQILNGLYLILEESSWCLPAHNAYIRDSKQFPLPDYERPVLDLFQAESGAVVAVAEYLLRPVLDQICPFISKDVNQRLQERIFLPYLNMHFWWMGNGEEAVNNWTVWCTQNVLLAAFTRDADLLAPEVQQKILEKAATSMDYFLDEYGEDGCCDEGAQYYGHAGLTLFNCMELIDEITDGGMQKAYQDSRIRNIASYILKVYVGNACYINFADCSPRAGRRGAREYLFAKATGNAEMMAFAAQDYRESEDPLLLDEHNLYYRLQQIFTHEEMQAYRMWKPSNEDVWFESVGLMIARDGVYTLAAKAGDNADSHNHNDTGSFTLYKYAQPMLIDLGVETYTQKTFSDRRYEIWTMQSQYHNLPSFLEQEAAEKMQLPDAEEAARSQKKGERKFVMQQDGAVFAARETVCTRDAGQASLEMELADTYPDERIRSYRRRIALNRGMGVLVEDFYEGDLECILTLMTYEQPVLQQEIEAGCCRLNVGNLGSIQAEGVSAVKIEICPIKDARLQGAWKHDCYRILLKMEKQKVKLLIQ